MSLASLAFVLFFLAVVALRMAVRTGSGYQWLLLVASICFYLTWSVRCLLLILFTAMMDYSIVRRLDRTTEPSWRRRLLFISLVANLGLLGFFKYSNFFLENVWALFGMLGMHSPAPHLNIVLPPAISFYTFASISYVIDVYYERIPACRSARDYTLFITFFPKLLAGPIMRAGAFFGQLAGARHVGVEDVEIGIGRFLVGAVKKLVIADQVAPHVSLIFSAPSHYDGFTLLQGLLGYAVQLYCDFSGYCDMAIGCARILGIRVPENFQMPFSAASITEFWRRWHITLSTWLRDYVFLPLEIATRDARNGTVRASINVFVTFLLCGLWHGASWNFVIWGGIMGAALATHIAWMAWNPLTSLGESHAFQRIWVVFSHGITLGVVILSFAFARAQSVSDAVHYIGRMCTWSHDGTTMVSPYILSGVVVLIAVHLLVGKDRNLVEEVVTRAMPVRIVAYSSLLLLLALFAANAGQPFIYFQF
jgi:alginate O-acetyltransferase complex protein AlgI